MPFDFFPLSYDIDKIFQRVIKVIYFHPMIPTHGQDHPRIKEDRKY